MQKAKVVVNQDGADVTLTGELVSQNQDVIVLNIDGAERTFEKVEVLSFKIINNKPKAEKVVKAPRGPSAKRQAALEVVRDNPTMKRKEQIALIMEKTGMTSSGASTYHQNARKELGLVGKEAEAPATTEAQA